MVKLTAELIEQAAQYTNAVRDRELDLRADKTFCEMVKSNRLCEGELFIQICCRPLGGGPQRCPYSDVSSSNSA